MMEDAYLIGIRLALDNGVSAGVAAIRQDLGILDGAIASTAANLRQLQAIASQTVNASVPQQSRAPALPSIKPQAVPDISSAPSVTSPNASSGALLDREQSQPRVVDKPIAIAPIQFAAPPVAVPDAAQINVNAEIGVPVTKPTVAVAPHIAPAPALPTAFPTPSIAPSMAPVVESSAIGAVAPRPIPIHIFDQQHQNINTTLPSASPPPAPQLVCDAPYSESPHSPIPLSVAPDQTWRVPSSVAPQTGERAAQSTQLQPEPPSPRQAVAPRAQAAPSGPVGGDVFLDGARLGHWLASTLAREVGRPPTGATSFDPRLGISWPGAQQSGG